LEKPNHRPAKGHEPASNAAFVEGEQLLNWAVLPGGGRIQMSFRAVDGATHRIALPFDALSGLLMTLPTMLQAALNMRSVDQSLRVAQPLSTWRLEQVEGAPDLLLRLGTKDGFEISFALDGHHAESLGSALLVSPHAGERAASAKPH
jgi:hypothetical protein